MRRWAGAQHGLVTREQLRGAGASRQAVSRRLHSPDWVSVTPRVLRLAGAPPTVEQRALAAVLDAGGGAVVSHASAAALWRLPGFDLRTIELSRPRTGTDRATSLATLHHPRLLPDAHRTRRSGVPTTTLARTVVDLGRTEHADRVELALHAAVRLGLRWADAEAIVVELQRRGREGVPVARSLVAAHRDRRPLGSGLEARVLRLLASAGLPEPRRQVDVGAGDWVGRVDFLYDDVRLVIEVDGCWHHEGVLGVRRDKRRTAALAAAGFRVLPLSEDLIRTRPDVVVELVGDARRLTAPGTGRRTDTEEAPVRGPEAGTARRRSGGQRPMAPAARSSAMAQPKAMR